MRIIAPLKETLNLNYSFFCFCTKQVRILSIFAKYEQVEDSDVYAVKVGSAGSQNYWERVDEK